MTLPADQAGLRPMTANQARLEVEVILELGASAPPLLWTRAVREYLARIDSVMDDLDDALETGDVLRAQELIRLRWRPKR